jgi:hypothetical protein
LGTTESQEHSEKKVRKEQATTEGTDLTDKEEKNRVIPSTSVVNSSVALCVSVTLW